MPVRADDDVKYVFARMGDDDSLVYRINGRDFAEEQLPDFFRSNERQWSKSSVELRVVFRNDVSLAWFDYGCRSFRIRGFKRIHCYAGSERTGKAIRLKAAGDVLVLPKYRW